MIAGVSFFQSSFIMKHLPPTLAAVLGLAALVPAVATAEDNKPVKIEKKEVRVLTGPEHERRVFIREGDRREKPEMELATFLGVEVAPVPAALCAQLGLPRGTGLVVGHVAPKSAATGVLQEHDVLLKLDDQILIEARQLSVLVRNHKEGDEVTLTYLRGGQRATAKVKLGSHEVPKFSWSETPGPGSGLLGIHGGGRMDFFPAESGAGPQQRAEVDQLLSLMRRAPAGDPVRIQIERRDGPGIRAMSVNPNTSNLVFSDGEGSLELITQEGMKTLVAKDAAGGEVFAGPVTTPEERQALPARVRERLERLEGMREMTFKTDGDFKGSETRVVRPLGRGIALPRAVVSTSRMPERI